MPEATRRRLLVLAAVVGGGLVAGYLALFLYVGGDVPRGTSVEGVDIGGLPADEAVELLSTQLAEPNRMVLVVDGHRHPVSTTEVGLSLDAEATVAAAGERSPNPWTLLRLAAGQDVTPQAAVEQSKLTRTLDQLARSVDHPARDGRVRYDGLTPVAVEPRPGRALDREASETALVTAYASGISEVTLPVVDVQPAATSEAVAEVLDGLAVTAVSAPVTIEVDGTSVVVEPEQVATVLVFVPSAGRLVPEVRVPMLRDEVADQLAQVEVAAEDASFDVSSGRPRVVPGHPGRGVADAALARAVVEAMSQESGRSASAELSNTAPDLTTAEAKDLGITEVISSYNQWFPYAEYRVTNIGQAAERMNGTVIQPGETFSLNGIVGERTPENGFVKGYIIVGNRLVEDYGGAVSTITTATWHAAFFAGMTRIEQRAHGYWISRYTPGLEATVSWGNLDLKWRNDTPYGVLVTTAMTSESVTVTLWSTKYWDITAEFGPRRNVTRAGVVYDPGEGCVEQEGVDGFDITVTRVWSRHGDVKRREPLDTHYVPAPTVYCEAKPKPTPSPTEGTKGDGGGATPTPTPSASRS